MSYIQSTIVNAVPPANISVTSEVNVEDSLIMFTGAITIPYFLDVSIIISAVWVYQDQADITSADLEQAVVTGPVHFQDRSTVYFSFLVLELSANDYGNTYRLLVQISANNTKAYSQYILPSSSESDDVNIQYSG